MIITNIARQELRRMFCSPFSWVLLGLIQFLLAIIFFALMSHYFEAAKLYSGRGLTEVVVAGLLQYAGLILLLVTPFITMRLFSDEQRNGTILLLFSSPVSMTELVLGKYIGVVFFFGIMLVMIALMPLSLLLGSSLDLGQLASSLLGLALLMAAIAAIGMFISSLTRQPAVAAVGTFGVLFILWIIHIAAVASSSWFVELFSYLSMMRHYNSMLTGMFSSIDVIYYLLITVIFILLSIWRLDAIRCYR